MTRPSGSIGAPTVSDTERRRRWRLVLGPAADDVWSDAERRAAPDAGDPGRSDDAADPAAPGDPGDDDVVAAGDAGDERDRSGTGAASNRPSSGPGLHGDDRRIDAALGALYDRAAPGSRGRGRAGGLSRSTPTVVRWLGDIRRYFPTPVVQILQRDAVDRLDLRQLLLEPELLQSVEPDIHLVTLLV